MNLKLKRALLAIALTLSLSSFSQDGFLGEIRMFAGNFEPKNWAFCEGQLLSINSNPALYSLVGTIYGGNGITTFGLPDFRGRAPIGVGSGPGLSTQILGQKKGTETNVLSVSNLPSHSHTVNASVQSGTSTDPTGKLLADTSTFDNEYSSEAPDATMNSAMIGNTGGGQAVNNMQPSIGTHYIICLQGIYPSRN